MFICESFDKSEHVPKLDHIKYAMYIVSIYYDKLLVISIHHHVP